jgi:hypothetical protein
MTSRVRFYVDAWDPSYGSGLDLGEAGPTAESSAQLGVDVELPADSWRALAPPADLRAPHLVLLVDGVRRLDARIWIEDTEASLQLGLAASYAAGVVRCDLRRGSAEVAGARVERGLFTPSPHTDGLVAANARYPARRVAATEPTQLSAAVQSRLHTLEEEVSLVARHSNEPGDDLLVVDGPLRGRTQLDRALGYVKTHRVQYLPPDLTTVVGRLRPGQRSPVFLLGTSWHRYSWYLKLPGLAGSPWAGVVRVEASADLPRGEVIGLADR